MSPAELTPVLAPASALLSVEDVARTRTVYVAIALLVLLGLAMVVLAVWLVRRTRVDPAVLAPLEAMGERSWRRSSDDDFRRARLDDVRPAGAVTLAAIAPFMVDDDAADSGHDAPADGDGGLPADGPLHGPPVPVHALTSEEIDEILRRFGGVLPVDTEPEPAVAEPAADAGGEAVDRTVDGPVAADVDEPVGADADEADGDAGTAADVAGGEADPAPDEQPTHG